VTDPTSPQDDTTAGPCNDDTELHPTAQAPEVVEAWSLDDEPDEQRHSWRSAWGIVAIIAACSVVVAGVVGLVVWVSRAGSHDVPPPPTAAPTTTVAAPASTTAPATTITAPSTPKPAPVLSAEDHRLLHNLRSADDYTIDNPALVVEHAHRYCDVVRQGFSSYQAWQTVVSEAGDQIGMHSSRPLFGAARTPTEMVTTDGTRPET
jgi:hypothetical protein